MNKNKIMKKNLSKQLKIEGTKKIFKDGTKSKCKVGKKLKINKTSHINKIKEKMTTSIDAENMLKNYLFTYQEEQQNTGKNTDRYQRQAQYQFYH